MGGRRKQPAKKQPAITEHALPLLKMFYDLRDRFPLHFVVFKQVSSHIPHEANVEEYFSRAVR